MKKTVDVKILDPRLHDHPPAYATTGSAGIDLRACITASMVIQPGQCELIPSGIAIHLADPKMPHYGTAGAPRPLHAGAGRLLLALAPESKRRGEATGDFA